MVTPYSTGAILMVFLAVSDEHELGLHAHFLDQFGEAANVGFVERGVDFVEDAERAGRVLEDANQQRPARLSAFSPPGEQEHALQALARRGGYDVDAALGAVFFVGQLHEGVASAEQLLEGSLEVFVDLGESFLELLTRRF